MSDQITIVVRQIRRAVGQTLSWLLISMSTLQVLSFKMIITKILSEGNSGTLDNGQILVGDYLMTNCYLQLC